MTDTLSPLVRAARDARQRAGITQTQLADTLGLQVNDIWLFEHGERHLEPALLRQLLRVVGIDPARADMPGEYIAISGTALVERPQHACIRDARERQGWSQESVAQQLGVSRGAYRRIEQGTVVPSIDVMRRIADLLAIDRAKLGLADHGIVLSDAELLPVIWDLFYGGRSATIRPLLPTLSSYLATSAPALPIVLGYQVLGVMLRDQHDLDGADRALSRAITMARALPGGGPDIMAAALFRRSVVVIDKAARAPAQRIRWYQEAQRYSTAALDLAGRCRPVLRGVIMQQHAKILAYNGASERQIEPLLHQAAALAATTYGMDESGVVLRPAGVLHALVDSRVILAQVHQRTSGLVRAMSDSATVLATLERDMPRWKLNVGLSQVAGYVAGGADDLALETTELLVPLLRSSGSDNLLWQLRDVVGRLPDTPDRRHALGLLE